MTEDEVQLAVGEPDRTVADSQGRRDWIYLRSNGKLLIVHFDLNGLVKSYNTALDSKQTTKKKPVRRKTTAKKPVAKKPVSKAPVAKTPVTKPSVSKPSASKNPVTKKPANYMSEEDKNS